ncbi:MAG: hypothetical protein ACOVQS_00020, partial [Chitinophagaceae bacterium]
VKIKITLGLSCAITERHCKDNARINKYERLFNVVIWSLLLMMLDMRVEHNSKFDPRNSSPVDTPG